MYILNILNHSERTQEIYIQNYSRIRFTKENSHYLMKHQKEKDLILLETK